jgi:hypothetical protein
MSARCLMRVGPCRLIRIGERVLIYSSTAGMVELVVTACLKRAALRVYGFDSRFRHHFKISSENNMKKTLLKELQRAIKETEDSLQKLNDARRALQENGIKNATFIVQVYSSWNDEKDIKVVEQMPLQKVIEKAEAEFMAVNHRSDVQCNYFVYIVLNGLQVIVPDALWRSFTQKSRNGC